MIVKAVGFTKAVNTLKGRLQRIPECNGASSHAVHVDGRSLVENYPSQYFRNQTLLGPFMLQVKTSKKYLDTSGKAGNGVRHWQWDCAKGNRNQVFSAEYIDGE